MVKPYISDHVALEPSGIVALNGKPIRSDVHEESSGDDGAGLVMRIKVRTSVA